MTEVAYHIWLNDLPVPPSPNTWKTHRMELVKQKNGYKRSAWVLCCSRNAPQSHPPDNVTVWVKFRLKRLRDEDNLYASCKWLLDVLKLPRKGDVISWKQGIAEAKGYFVDDSPDRMKLHVSQEKDRKDAVDVKISWQD